LRIPKFVCLYALRPPNLFSKHAGALQQIRMKIQAYEPLQHYNKCPDIFCIANNTHVSKNLKATTSQNFSKTKLEINWLNTN